MYKDLNFAFEEARQGVLLSRKKHRAPQQTHWAPHLLLNEWVGVIVSVKFEDCGPNFTEVGYY